MLSKHKRSNVKNSYSDFSNTCLMGLFVQGSKLRTRYLTGEYLSKMGGEHRGSIENTGEFGFHWPQAKTHMIYT